MGGQWYKSQYEPECLRTGSTNVQGWEMDVPASAETVNLPLFCLSKSLDELLWTDLVVGRKPMALLSFLDQRSLL